jgi:hypothetical protein
MKLFFIVLFLLVVAVIALTAFQNYPANAKPKSFERLSDTANIKRCLELVVNTPKPRWFRNTDVLDTVANRVRAEFLEHTNRVSFQNFAIGSNEYRNVIASFGPHSGKRIIVGAHYDVCGEQDGADDNASGVAGILELARLLKNAALKYRIDLVAYSTEEPPYFGTSNMGSYVHAKSLHDEKAAVLGMISLEMIGYYKDEPNSQRYPVGILKAFYGNKGNFITVVQKSFSGKFARQYKRLAFEKNSLPTKSFRAPSFFGGIDLSDHRNYWKFGYSAVMITNTSFYRNHNYHRDTDRIATLDINRMSMTIDGVYRTLIAFE